jgi:hypothetical protein
MLSNVRLGRALGRRSRCPLWHVLAVVIALDTDVLEAVLWVKEVATCLAVASSDAPNESIGAINQLL